MRRAATGVDEHHAVAHLRDGLLVDEMVRLGRERAVEADDVGFAEQFPEVHVGAEFGRTARMRIRIEAEDAAAHAGENLRMRMTPIFPVPTMPAVRPFMSKPMRPSREKSLSRTRL